MKRALIQILLFIFACSSFAEIHTISSMAELEASVKQDDLILFDLDHTVFEGAEPYGHANWFYDRINEGKQQGIHPHETVRKIFPEWLASQQVNTVVPVEPIIPALIRRLQDQGIQVMALTARQIPLVDATLRQVASLEIDFARTALPLEEISLWLDTPAAYHDGILFTSEFNPKGQIFKTFPRKSEYPIKRIIVVDDIRHHLVNLQETFEPEIEVVGLHYPLVENRRNIWDADHAKQEYERRKPMNGDL